MLKPTSIRISHKSSKSDLNGCTYLDMPYHKLKYELSRPQAVELRTYYDKLDNIPQHLTKSTKPQQITDMFSDYHDLYKTCMLNPTDPILTKMIRSPKKQVSKADKDMNVYVKYNPESKATFEQETVRQRIRIV